MAQSRKSNGTKKKTNSKKQTAKQQELKLDNGIRSEIILCLILGISIVLCISNFGIGGKVGGAVSSFFFGLLGTTAYIFPFVLFFGAAFYIANKNNALVTRKLIGAGILFIFICVLFQLLFCGYTAGTPIWDYYKESADSKLGGGLLGGLITAAFSSAFGIVGAYAITLIGIIIAAIIMTQRPLISQFKEKSVAAYDHAKEERKRRKETTFNVEETDLKKSKKKDTKQIPEKVAEVPTPDVADVPVVDAEAVVVEETIVSEPVPEFVINRGDSMDILQEEKKESVQTDISMKNISIGSDLIEITPVLEEDSVISADDIQLKPVDSVVNDLEENAEMDVFDTKKKNPRSSKEEIENNIANIKEEIAAEPPKPKKVYKLPPLNLLKPANRKKGDSDQHLRETAAKLQQTLHSFGVEVTVTNASCGPTVTRYELQPEQGVKVSKIVALTDDIKLNLAAADIRIEAPIPGKAAVGIEVPNQENTAVMLRELFQSEAYVKTKASIPFAVGKDIAGNAVIVDIAKMPHLLIAGATGSGKSVCINTLIMSILYKANPDEVKLIMIDPKVVELSVYNGIPHLLIPVVTDPKKAAGALNWAVAEMTERYNIFAEFNVRDLSSYNEKAKAMIADPDIPEADKPKLLPKIVIIVDELADLMMVAPGEAEDAICRLAQLARACGIHLIIATQRPSVNVITGLIKANMPSRIAFSVSSGVDSRTILDMNGAEKLLGKGDMLFYPQGYPKPARLQGAFISDEEVNAVVKFIASQQDEVVYNSEIESKISVAGSGGGSSASGGSDYDAYFAEAGRFIIEKDKASIGMLQRVFKIGFNRAARIMDQLCETGVVGPEEGTKPRKVLMSMEQFEQVIEELV